MLVEARNEDVPFLITARLRDKEGYKQKGIICSAF
jgi:hypothetical protein